MFVIDGATDTCTSGGTTLAAEWLTTGTDASAGQPKYGVRHDHGTGDTTTSAAWQALGLGTSLSSIDLISTIPPLRAVSTEQGHPATLAICSDHMSMARDGCMPTDLAGATGATAPSDAWLFDAYTWRMCYACSDATCL